MNIALGLYLIVDQRTTTAAFSDDKSIKILNFFLCSSLVGNRAGDGLFSSILLVGKDLPLSTQAMRTTVMCCRCERERL